MTTMTATATTADDNDEDNEHDSNDYSAALIMGKNVREEVNIDNSNRVAEATM